MRLTIKTIVCAAIVLPIFASGADAAKRKPAKHTTEKSRIDTPARYRSRDLFAPGPVYFGNKYLGTDPDPFIRLMIQRDPSAVFGGEG